MEPSAGEREGHAPRKEEPSAGEREGHAPRKEEPSAGEREGPAPPMEQTPKGACDRGVCSMGRSVWLGRRRSRRIAQAKRRPGYGALA